MPVKQKEEKENTLIFEKNFEKLKIRETKPKFSATSREEKTKFSRDVGEILKLLGITAGFSAISAVTIKLIKLPSELILFLPPLFLVFTLFGKSNFKKENSKISSNAKQEVERGLDEKLKEAIEAAIKSSGSYSKKLKGGSLNDLLKEIEKVILAKPVREVIEKIEEGNISIKIGDEKPLILYLFKSGPILLVIVAFKYRIILRATYLVGCNAIKEINFVSEIDNKLVEEIAKIIKSEKIEVNIGKEEHLVFEKE